MADKLLSKMEELMKDGKFGQNIVDSIVAAAETSEQTGQGIDVRSRDVELALREKLTLDQIKEVLTKLGSSADAGLLESRSDHNTPVNKP